MKSSSPSSERYTILAFSFPLLRALTVFLTGVLALDEALEAPAFDKLAFGARALEALLLGVLAFEEAFLRAKGFGANSSSSRSSESRDASSTMGWE